MLALALAVFVPVVGGALVAAELAAGQTERHAAADIQARLGQMAGQADDALMAQVQVRLAAMQAAAAQWRLDAARDAVPADRLRALQMQHPELNWIGVQDASGRVQVATDDDESQAAGRRQPSWLARGIRAPMVILHRASGDDDSDALVLVVPLVPGDGPGATALVARLPWLWLQAQVNARLRAMAGGVPVELLLLDAQGRLLAGPAQGLGAEGVDAAQGGRYLVGRAQARADAEARGTGTGWQVLVREDAARALEPARQARQAVLVGVLAVGLLAALAALGVTRWLLRRLDQLARQARAVATGARSAIEVPAGRDEVHAIGATMAELIDRLQAEKATLTRLNAELDARVAVRTARIERLAADARRAAVTRERLRLARELHDALGHSLMALLTQVRMVRKLAGRWSPGQLDAELAEAEQVAATGLAEVRSAIGQMRETGLGDTGLGVQLQALLQHLAEATGVAVEASIDPAAGELVDERAAIVLNMVREALRNVERHAQARRVTLRLVPEPSADAVDRSWQLELADNGVGFNPRADHPGHYGLVGLHEQAEQLGATLTLDSAPGQGCRLRLRFAG